MIEIGYWNNSSNKYPMYSHPKDLIDESFWNTIDKINISKYLVNGTIGDRYFGWSECRICGEELGFCDRNDGKYIWPDKLSHYINVHNVTLPIEFINHILNKLG